MFDIGTTQEQIEKTTGVSQDKGSHYYPEGTTYIDVNTGFGIEIVFDENKKLITKALYYPNQKEIEFLTPKGVNGSQSRKIDCGDSYEKIKEILKSDGIEISTTQLENGELQRTRIWLNHNNSPRASRKYLKITFSQDEIAGEMTKTI